MVKHTQTIRRQKPTNCLSVFDHFVGLVRKGLNVVENLKITAFSNDPSAERLSKSTLKALRKYKNYLSIVAIRNAK